MTSYFILWVTFLILRSIHVGYILYKRERKAGMLEVGIVEKAVNNKTQTGVAIKHTLAAAIATLLNPSFILIETVKFLPIALIYWLIS